MVLQNWLNVLLVSLGSVWNQFLAFLPGLIGAVVLLIIGWLVAVVLERIVDKLVQSLKLDDLLAKADIREFLHRAHMELNSGYFLGKVVYWLVFLSFVLAASDILDFDALSLFIKDVIFYIPNVAIAFLIMVATLIVSHFVRKAVMASVMATKLHKARFLGSLAAWAVIIFGLLTAASQLLGSGAEGIINSVIVGFIIMLSLAGGLAFGLGGKDEAARLLVKLREDWENAHK